MTYKKGKGQSQLQLMVLEKYQERVSEARARLCSNCAFLNSRQCQNLYPVTSDGGDCPYFSESRATLEI